MTDKTWQIIHQVRHGLLRLAYCFIAFGLMMSAWPEVLASAGKPTDPDSVVQSFLVAISILALLGMVYPLKMLPLMIFEFLWKLTWVAAYGLPALMENRLDDYGIDVLGACVIGLVVTPIVMPWRHMLFGIFAKPDPWGNSQR